MSTRHVREIVEENRSRGTSPPPETASPTGNSRRQSKSSNAAEVVDFIAKFSTAAATHPLHNVATILTDLGYDKGADSDNELESSGSSFSFHLDTSSTSHSFGVNRTLKSQLACFSTMLSHRSWIENNRDVYAAVETDVAGDTEKTMVPFRCSASIMFVDLSGYSTISAALSSSGGAHALSNAVNAYFEAILTVVEQYNGEVLTFAGDAIVVCFPCVHDEDATTTTTMAHTAVVCCVQAAACALDLQRKCGMSPVPGTDLFFRLHIGITYGELESQVFVCPGAQTMQKAYHFVNGLPLKQTSIVVDAAKKGQICVTEEVRRGCAGFLHVQEVRADGHDGSSVPATPATPGVDRIYLLSGIDEDHRDVLRHLVDNSTATRSPWLETNLVPPAVAKKLKQGFKASHMSEMRFLCVLFIRKLDDRIGAAEWFNEVQQILDESRCPIVQVLDDDKGMHVVAAVNLYVTERSPATVGILAARKLMERETGCAIGMACGEVFCGITGSTNACRWDMTGPACVLAARLMQHSVTTGIPTCFAPSVFESTRDTSQLEPVPEKVQLKGSPAPITIFTLSETSISATAGIMNVAWGSLKLLRAEREQLSSFFASAFQRGVAMVSGPVGSGKKTLISLTLEQARFMNVVHEATRERTPLSVAAMLGEWFAFHEDKELSTLGLALTVSLKRRQVARTLSLSLQLIQLVIEKGIRCCLVVAYAHLLDASSMSFIKAAMSVAPSVTGTGKFYVVLTAYMLYGATPVDQLVSTLQRGLTEHEQVMRRAGRSIDDVQREVVHVKVEYAKSAEEFAEGVHGVLFFHMKPRTSQVFFEATGGCLGLIPALQKVITDNMLAEVDKVENGVRRLIAPSGVDGMVYITHYGEDYLFSEMNWPQVAPEVSARFTELYDALPPRHQLVLRVIASLSSTAGSANTFVSGFIMGRLNEKFTVERVNADINQLISLNILKPAETGDWSEVQFTVPALVDIVGALLTPEQDKALKRIVFKRSQVRYQEIVGLSRERNFVPDEEQDVQWFPVLVSYFARLARAAGSFDVYRRLMAESWEFTLMVTGADGSLRPDLRTRMETRLAVERRRFPQEFTPSLFDKFDTKPLLDNFVTGEHLRDRKDIVFVPASMDRARYMTFPVALGAISGELQKILWALTNNALDFNNPDKIQFIDPEFRKYLTVDVDAFIAVIEKFEGKIPHLPNQQLHPAAIKSIADERALVQSLCTYPGSAAEALQQLDRFCDYYDHTILPRRDRIVAYVQGLTDPEYLAAKCLAPSAVKTAFALFVRPAPIPSAVVHKALLVLATAGWQTKYFSTNLQSIRDAVLRQRTATEYDFKAFLFSLLAFGDEITSGKMRVA